MRCFIAIDIDDRIRARIRDLQAKLCRETGLRAPEAKWVDPDLTHLTVKFLGEVRDAELPVVCRVVSEISQSHENFAIDIEGLGCFSSPAKVLWIGIGKSEALSALQADLEQRLETEGWPPEARKFHGHLTLCRVKNHKAGRKIQNRVADYTDVHLGSVQVDSVCIYKSDLTSSGPVYTLISESALK